LSGTHFIGEVRDTTEATIDDPIEVYTTTHKIQMKLVGVWLYNLATGEILKKFSPFEK